MPTTFTLSAFADEIDPDLGVQLEVLRELKIGYLELRSAWGTNVLKMDGGQVETIRRSCELSGVKVSCIGSPLGKSPIEGPIEDVLEDLGRVFRVAKSLDTSRIRIFSFYPSGEDGLDGNLRGSISRLTQMALEAENHDKLLLLENETGLVGDTPERCHAIVSGVKSPSLQFVWDTGNFAHAGLAGSVDKGWPLLDEYTDHVQVKDHRHSDGVTVPAGEGDGQVQELLAKLRDRGGDVFLALEPHLVKGADRRGGKGIDAMRRAAAALREVMAAAGCAESPAFAVGG
jgi:sugar phosphate isomerase/epimerase